MEDLKDILKEIVSYRRELNLKFSDDMALDCSTRIFNSKNIDLSKKENIKEMKGNLNKPSEKQRNLLLKMRVKNIDNLTKEEATAIIRESIEKSKNKKEVGY